MAIRKTLTFKAKEPEFKIIKRVHLYISEKHSEIIITPISNEPENEYGYEQSSCEVLKLDSSPETIGKAIKRNFDKSNIAEREKRSSKKSDWPSFKASKEGTVRGFEEHYQLITVKGVTYFNSSLRIQTVLNLPIEIDLTTTISAHCLPVDLGNRVLRMFYSDIVVRDSL